MTEKPFFVDAAELAVSIAIAAGGYMPIPGSTPEQALADMTDEDQERWMRGAKAAMDVVIRAMNAGGANIRATPTDGQQLQ